MRKSFIYVVSLCSFLLLLTFCESKKNSEPKARGPRGPVLVEGFVVQPRAVSDNIQVSGSLLPFEETQIRGEVSGRIVQLNFKEGSQVSNGMLLVKLFDRDLQAQLNKLKVQLKIKEKTAERNKELLAINGISQEEYDLSTLDVENLRADME